MAPLFEIAVCTIFAREVLEAILIIGNYRKVIKESDDFKKDPERQAEALKAVTRSACLASLLALVMIIITGVTLYYVSKDLDKNVIRIIEGVSKVVAAIFILQLSYKLPKWLGVYAAPKKNYQSKVDGLSIKSIKFNIAWNLWREVAECGAFLIPFFLGDQARSIPISGIVGILVGGLAGLGIFWASDHMHNKGRLAFFLAAVTGQLSVGLFTGGCHEFEEVWGETPTVWKIEGDFWDYKKLPMTLIKPFGYSHSRTVLQICCFWGWMLLLVGVHYKKWKESKRFREEEGTNEVVDQDKKDEEKGSESALDNLAHN